MVKSLLILCLLFLLGFSVNAQADKTVSLLIYYTVDDTDDELKRFVRFDFLNGQLISQKEIFTIDSDKSGFNYYIYAKRYIVSNETFYGSRPEDKKTYDLKINKFINRQNMPFIKDRVNFEQFVLRSPDGKKSIDFKPNSMTKNPLIIKVEGQKDIVINENFTVTVSSKSSNLPILPLIWLDNETILTQRRNGNLVKVNLDKTITDFPEIPCSEESFPYFKKMKSGYLNYRCSSEEFRISIENNSFEKIKPDLDFGFSEEYGNDEAFYYKNQKIEQSGVDTLTTDGYLASTFGLKNKNGFYDSNDINTVKIWNRFTGKWQEFKFDGSHLEILGWYIETD